MMFMIERIKLGNTFKCPSCRTRVNIDEISYVSEGSGNQGEYAHINVKVCSQTPPAFYSSSCFPRFSRPHVLVFWIFLVFSGFPRFLISDPLPPLSFSSSLAGILGNKN